jgi:hypothetical protein
MLKTVINPYVVPIKDTGVYEFTPQVKISGTWTSVTPDSYEAHLEKEPGTSLQELTVLDMGSNEYRAYFYADDSMFDTEPTEATIEINEEFFVAFYWEYTSGEHITKKTERLQVRIVAVN